MDWQAYEQETAVYRQQLEESLKRENGWLALAGLFWLEEGDNYFGTSADETVVVPLAEDYGRLGNFIRQGDQVTMQVTGSVDICVNGQAVQEIVLQPDRSGAPTMVTVQQVTMMLKQMENVLAIRMWDNGRSERQTFAGRNWFPLNEDYRVIAKFIPDDSLPPIMMSRSVGADFEQKPAGMVHFSLMGEDRSMVAFDNGNGRMFLLFKDKTNGKETYGAGRYLYSQLGDDGKMTIDFNRAHHPPCKFTTYATCTLPPRQNWLPVSIEVGERL